LKCPTCGNSMELVGYKHYHCSCGRCIWGNLVLTYKGESHEKID